MRVLICGGGVIGASIAYFLSCRGVETIVIDRAGLACAASGKSGGFLALDWCDGTPLEPLARRSFALHARLAQEIGTEWNYRPLATYAGSMGLGQRGSSYRIDWLSAEVSVSQRLGSAETTVWCPNCPPSGWACCPAPGVATYWVWGPSGGAFDYPFADWRGPTGGWGNP